MNFGLIKILILIAGFFYLIYTLFQHRNEDMFFYIGIAVLAGYLYLMIKIMDSYAAKKHDK